MTDRQRAKVKFIVNADRAAGWGSSPKPPNRLVGKIVTIRRDLINWHAYCYEHKGESYIFSHAELNLPRCSCRDCEEVKRLKK